MNYEPRRMRRKDYDRIVTLAPDAPGFRPSEREDRWVAEGSGVFRYIRPQKWWQRLLGIRMLGSIFYDDPYNFMKVPKP